MIDMRKAYRKAKNNKLLVYLKKKKIINKIKKCSFKSNENIHKKGEGSYCAVSANKVSDPVMTRQQSQRTNTANLKKAVDSKTINKNGVQIIKNLPRI